MAPSRKKSIWLGEPILALLASRQPQDDDNVNVSGAINTAVARYLEIVKRHMPAFTVEEWCAIFDALNGVWMSDSWSPTYICAEVHDTAGLGQKWGIDQAALVCQLQGLTYVEAVAVADVAEQFWASPLQATDDGWRPIIVALVGDKALSE